MTTIDPIVSEVRAVRDKHAAQFGYNLKEIFRDIKKKQKASGRKICAVSIPCGCCNNCHNFKPIAGRLSQKRTY